MSSPLCVHSSITIHTFLVRQLGGKFITPPGASFPHALKGGQLDKGQSSKTNQVQDTPVLNAISTPLWNLKNIRKYLLSKCSCPMPTQTKANLFESLCGSALKWNHGLYLDILRPILAKLQDGASTIPATNSCPSKSSYQLLPNVSALVQQGHLSPCAT